MTETSLGWHQVGCSRCVDQRWRTVWPILCWCRRKTMLNQSKRTTVRPVTAYAARGDSHCHLI